MYADWLLESGDARGQLIGLRRRVEVERLCAAERMQLLDRLNVLWDAHQPDWLRGLALPRSTRLRWRHGFLVGVSFFWPGGGVIEGLRALAEHPVGRLLSEIEIERLPPGELPEALLEALAAAPPRSLSLGFYSLDVAAVEQLADSGATGRLSVLKLDGLDPRGLDALLWRGRAVLSRVTELDLSHSALGPEGAAILAGVRPGILPSLQTLRLRRTGIEAVGARLLGGAGALAGLTELDLSDNLLGEEGARDVAEAPALQHLRVLSLYGNDIGDEGLASLSRSGALGSLRVLDVGFNGVGPVGSAALARWPQARELTELRLHDNRLGDSGIEPLATSGVLRGLQRLRLSDNYLSCDGAEALAGDGALGALRVLELRKNHIGDRGAVALSRSGSLQRCERLDLRENHVGIEGARALVASIPSLVVWALEDNALQPEDLAELRLIQQAVAPPVRTAPPGEAPGSLARLLRGVLRWIPSFGRT